VVTDLPAGVPSPPDLPHVSYVLADLQTGEIIAAKSAHALLYPASTLKTLTALVALPKLDPKRVITADAQDVAADGTRVGMVAGNRYTIDDLFNGLIMVSGNDTAYAIARAYGGRDRIIADMNAAAGRLGAWDTNAVDPSGLDADGQHTSAYDLALIGRAVMQLSGVPAACGAPAGDNSRERSTRPARPSRPSRLPTTTRSSRPTPAPSGSRAAIRRWPATPSSGRPPAGSAPSSSPSMGSVERQAPSVEALLTWGFAYAGQARPVGQLVAPGTATEPPEWRGASVTAPPSSADLLPSSDVDEPPASSAVAVAAESPLRSNEGVMAWWEAASDPARWTVAGGAGGVVAAFALLGVALGRRRARGAHQR
jgi:D-alanyl-D-alanine carboxypeptidase (penicillin-binding protein 5/6)